MIRELRFAESGIWGRNRVHGVGEILGFRIFGFKVQGL